MTESTEKKSRKSMKKTFAALTILLTLPLYANEWIALNYTSNEAATYETSLIEEQGFFTKDFSAWLKVTYEFDGDACGEKPTSTDFGVLYTYNKCKEDMSSKPKETVYKTSINCDKKTIESAVSSSVNIHGDFIHPSLQVGSHPGSLGYTLIEHYCK